MIELLVDSASNSDGVRSSAEAVRPKRLLLLTKGLGRGGTERLLVGGLSYLDPTRFEAEVAYLLPWKDALVAEVDALGVPVHCLGNGPVGRIAWIGRLRRLVRRGDFDIVHTHMPYPAVIARMLLFPHTPLLVHTEHNVWARYRRSTCWANALTYSRNRAVIAVSKSVATSIRPPWLGRSPKVEVVIHGIDQRTVNTSPTARADARATLGIGPDDEVIGTVGNFTPKKDHRVLLGALALLVPEHPTLRLVIVGSGPLEGKLRAQAATLGVGSHVIWAGSRSDVPDILPAFDLFVLSSLHEGLSIALLEAQAAGVPCVATNVGGIPEILEHGRDGLLIPPSDPAAIARAVGELLGDPERRYQMSTAARQDGIRYPLADAVNRLERIYEGVLAES